MIVFYYTLLQLLYELCKIRESDVVKTMGMNWKKVGRKLLPPAVGISDDERQLSFAEDKRILQTVEKNIYHKKPPLLLISFAPVSACSCDCAIFSMT